MNQSKKPLNPRPVVLVTGCHNSSVGVYIAKHFSLNNCITYAAARDIRKLTELEKYGCLQVQMDICSTQSIQKAVDFIIGSEGRIDILVNNAGVDFNGPIVELDIAKAANVLDTNVLGALRVTQAVAPTMIKNGFGTIVNVGSVVGDLTTPWGGLYSATKAALQSLTDALRLELRPFNIDVVIVKPGGVVSPILNNNFACKNYNEEYPNADRMSILAPDSFYKEVEGFVLKRVNFFKEFDLNDRDKFGQKVVSWVLSRRNPTLIKLGFWLNPANVALGLLTWSIGRISPKLAPSMSYFNDYSWTLSNELSLEGGTWAHTLYKYLPNCAREAAIWSRYGLGTLAIANRDTSLVKKE